MAHHHCFNLGMERWHLYGEVHGRCSGKNECSQAFHLGLRPWANGALQSQAADTISHVEIVICVSRGQMVSARFCVTDSPVVRWSSGRGPGCGDHFELHSVRTLDCQSWGRPWLSIDTEPGGRTETNASTCQHEIAADTNWTCAIF